MAIAKRVKPTEFLTIEEWLSISGRSSWRGLLCIAHAWAVVGLAMAIGYFWPILIPISIAIIGTRQLGLGILMHDAAHGALHSNLKINDWVGEHLCQPGLKAYRAYHLEHHKLAQQKGDPDLVLSAPFPISRGSFRRKLIRDLTGQTFAKQRFGRLFNALKKREPASIWTEIVRMRAFLLRNAVGFAVFAALGLWWVWLAMWLVPMATWLPMITRLRSIGEHGMIAVNEPDPLHQARTTLTNMFGRAFIAPYWVNYHVEHHMFMLLPCWKLPRLHKLLAAKGVTERMNIAPGYRTVLAAATSA